MVKLSRTHALPLLSQCIACIAIVLAVALSCFLVEDVIGYRVTALVLLLAVSVLAMLFEILPVLLAATCSAVLWNYFFIPPVLNFHIGSAEDLLMFLLYFVIALVNTVLTVKIRQAETKARDKEEQEKAIKLYNTLLNSLSHELRTPISAIAAAVEALKEKASPLTATQRSELLDVVDEANMRLDRQVENLLNMGRLESGTLRPKKDWCDVNEVVGNVVRQFEIGTPGHAMTFVPDAELPLFNLDGGLLEQMVHNLVHNAVVHTPVDSAILITAAHSDNACVVSIADQGPGIPGGEAERIFDKFHRLPGALRGGSGLGLSITKGFAEAQQGTLHVAPNTPTGAVFTLTIPAEASFLSNLKNE
jgi:two-component system sensor histidine kinase KdpD